MLRPSSQWDVLAVARFILAAIVLLAHLNGRVGGHGWTSVVEHLQDARSAVFGFLLISGYSIAASLERDEAGFLWRRVRRIYPVYLASLGFALVSSAVGAGAPQTLPRIAGTALMLQGFAVATISTDGQLWSVAVEWWNYLLAPIYRRVIDAGLWLLIALSFGLYLLFFPKDPSFMTGGIIFAQLSWMWLLGFLYYRHRRTLYGYSLLALPLLAGGQLQWIGVAVWIGAAALILGDRLALPASLGARLRWLGHLSYPVYALHVPVFALCFYYGVKSPGLIVAIVLVVSTAVLHSIDLPFRRLRLPVLWPRPAERPVAPAL